MNNASIKILKSLKEDSYEDDWKRIKENSYRARITTCLEFLFLIGMENLIKSKKGLLLVTVN